MSIVDNKKMIIKNRGGFTLAELLVYSGVFAVTAGLLVGVVNTVSKIQVRESANIEVSQQSEFVLNAIKAAMKDAKVIDTAAGEAATTLKVRVSDAAKDPTYIYVSGGTVYKKETDAGTPSALTDSLVTVDSLTFTRLANPPGRDVVKVDMTMAYNSAEPALQISKDFRNAIARVSAITFDSDILPSTDATYNVGATNPRWLNGFFSGNVDIGGLLGVGSYASDPGGAANGDIYYNTTSNAFKGYASGAWSALGGGSSLPSGTTGQTLRHDGTSYVSSSIIINDGTNVGIGKTPATKLDVEGVISATGGTSTDWNAKAPTANPTFTGTVTTAGMSVVGNIALGGGSPTYKLTNMAAPTGTRTRRQKLMWTRPRGQLTLARITMEIYA